jgi:hypothetical protein
VPITEKPGGRSADHAYWPEPPVAVRGGEVYAQPVMAEDNDDVVIWSGIVGVTTVSTPE